MSWAAVVQLLLYTATLLLLAVPLGRFLAGVLEGGPEHRIGPLLRWLAPLERAIYRLAGLSLDAQGRPPETDWRRYARDVLTFSLAGFAATYLLQRAQALLPLNPQQFPAVSPHLAFDTAVSFVTNTNWQSYGGETSLSYLVQALALGVQNFVSAATGIAVMAALARGIARQGERSNPSSSPPAAASPQTVGSFWQDLVRSTLYVLLPLSFVFALVLVAMGVVQTFAPYATVELLQPLAGPDGKLVTQQVLPLGPAASQIAIKQLGTNGGGFFNVNSAHPFENPTALSSFLECLAILVLPAACCIAFGRMVGDRRQGRALLLVMTVVFVLLLVPCALLEAHGNPALAQLPVDQALGDGQCGGNMEGKEARFGTAASALWAVATTAASNGSVNAMHDSFTPLGGMIPMWLMQLGEVIFGGVGSGLYGMVLFVVVTVFVAGLMVGRTPEYLGKKIEPFEMKMAAIGILAPAACVLVGTAVSVLTPDGRAGILNPGPHGFSEVLYAWSSAGNNNGSAFAGLTATNPFWCVGLALAMFVGRFFPIVAVLAVAGALAQKRRVAVTAGTLPTHTPLFGALLIGSVVLIGALTFLPALALGPIVEQCLLQGGR
jgi:K+-transporting ATPase ATPase A chain